MSQFFGNGVNLAERVLDFLWGRQNITVNNIANVDTPGFKSGYLTFESELASRLESARSLGAVQSPGTMQAEISKAIGSQQARIHITADESSRLDGNNVDMDQEQVELVRTAYSYEYMVNSINNELKRLNRAAQNF